MKRKVITIISIFTLICVVIGGVLWYRYEITRLQPYYKLYYALDSQCSEIAPESMYQTKQTRDLGKSTTLYTTFTVDGLMYQVIISTDNRRKDIMFSLYSGPENIDSIWLNKNRIAPFYEYTFEFKENKLTYPGENSDRVVPTTELQEAFEQEISLRLQNC